MFGQGQGQGLSQEGLGGQPPQNLGWKNVILSLYNPLHGCYATAYVSCKNCV